MLFVSRIALFGIYLTVAAFLRSVRRRVCLNVEPLDHSAVQTDYKQRTWHAGRLLRCILVTRTVADRAAQYIDNYRNTAVC